MVMTDARPIQANNGSRDSAGGHGEWLQRATAPGTDDIDHGVRIVSNDQEPDCDRQAVRG
jgi:hypothetical protein